MIASCEHSPLSFRQLADTKAYFLFKDIWIPNLHLSLPGWVGAGSVERHKAQPNTDPLWPGTGWGQPGMLLGQKWGHTGNQTMQLGLGRHWLGYFCLWMSNNEQLITLLCKRPRRNPCCTHRPGFSLGFFTLQWKPSTSSPSLGLHRSELIKSELWKISQTLLHDQFTWKIPISVLQDAQAVSRDPLSIWGADV